MTDDIVQLLRLKTYTETVDNCWGITRDQIEDAADEIEWLRSWKAEAMMVLAEWEKVWEAAGRPGLLGTSKAQAVAALFKDGAS